MQIFVYLAKRPTEYILILYTRAQTMPVQLTYGLQHSMAISLQGYEPF